MPAEFSRNEVARISKLANLELDESEIELFARQLGDILSLANELQKIDTTGVQPTANVGVQPTASVGEQPTDRADETRPCLDRAAALANAPDPAPGAGFYRVPRVIG